MSTTPALSDDPTLAPLLQNIFSNALEAKELYEIRARDIRAHLGDAGWSGPGASEEGWKGGWKVAVSEEWKRMVDEYHATQEQEEEDVKPKPASKYDRAAERNLNIFNAMVVGAIFADGEDLSDLEDGEDASSTIASDSGVGASDETGGSATRDGSMDVVDSDAVEQGQEEEEAIEVPVKSKTKPKAKASSKKDGKKSTKSANAEKPKKKKRSPKKKGEFKSKATISDSDAEADGTSASGSGSGQAAPSSSVHSEGESEEEGKKSKGRGKGKKSGGEKKVRKKREPKLKEGDAPKGTEEEEDRITKLKALLQHAGVQRPFTKETGAERTLSVSTRLDRLEGLLNDLGLKCGSGVGSKMPSEAKCKDVGEAKALEKEMKDLKGAPSTSGLRGGKKRASLGDDDDEDRPKKKFGAFLLAVQSDSD